MKFQILGSTGVYKNNEPIDLGATKVRGVLGILLLAANTGVARDTVVERLWPERSTANGGRERRRGLPGDGKNALHTYVSRLRGVLNSHAVPAELLREQDAYRLVVDRSAIDYYRFRDLAESGRQSARAGDYHDAISLFVEALDLWRGAPLADLISPWAQRQREDMNRNDLLATQYDLIDSYMAVNEIGRARERLRTLQSDNDTEEEFAQRWMRVVAVSEGPDKLPGYFRAFTERVRDVLDAEPSEYLHRIYKGLTRATVTAVSTVHGGRKPVPWQIPRPTPYFTGRLDATTDLNTKLMTPDGAPNIVSISGQPAVGKSEVANYWGTAHRQHFPDGGLHYNLNGYGPGEPPGALMVISYFLSSLGVAAEHLPEDVEGGVAMLKRVLAGRRMLVILDNARDSAQVRPLLAAMPNCWVIITSQQQLTSLVHRDGAWLVNLRPLSDDESIELLDRRIADPRITAERDAIRDLAELVGGLPLGLHVVADLVGTISQAPIRDLVAELRLRRRALLDAGNYGDDSATTLRTVFTLAWEARTPDVAGVYRILGLLPVAHVTTSALAALAGLSDEDAGRCLATLVGAHLIDQHGTDRFRLHDLLHLFTVELAAVESPEDRSAALDRLFDWYLGSTINAVRLVSPHLPMVSPLPSTTGVRPQQFEDSSVAMRWCVAERSAVLTIAQLAAAQGRHDHVWRLIGMFDDILNRFGDQADLLSVQRLALRSAELAGSIEGRIGHLNELGLRYHNLRRSEDAQLCFVQAYELSRGTDFEVLGDTSLDNLAALRKHQGANDEAVQLLTMRLRSAEHRKDVLSQAFTSYHLGDTYRRMARVEMAAEHFQVALRLYDGLEDARGRGEVRSALGQLALTRGDAHTAIDYCEQALDFNRQAMDERLIAESLVTLTLAYCEVGQCREAIGTAGEAVAICREAVLPDLAVALKARAEAYFCAGDQRSAKADWQECARILQESGSPEAIEIQALADGIADIA